MYRNNQAFGVTDATDYGLEPGLMEDYLPSTGGSSTQFFSPSPSSSSSPSVLPIVIAGGLAAIAILYFATR